MLWSAPQSGLTGSRTSTVSNEVLNCSVSKLNINPHETLFRYEIYNRELLWSVYTVYMLGGDEKMVNPIANILFIPLVCHLRLKV